MKLTSEQLSRRLQQLQTLESHLTFRLTRLSKLAEQQGHRLLKGVDLHLTSYRMILVVDIFEEITLSDLSQIMAIDGAQVSRTAKELCASELLEYRPVPGNQRKKYLAVTAAGEQLLAKLKPRFDERDQAIERALKEDGVKNLEHGIDVIADLILQDIGKR